MTMPATKATEAFSLIDTLVALKDENLSGLEFGLQRLQKMIAEIEKSQLVVSYSLWGAYYGLIDDVENMHKYYALAVSSSPASSAVYANYSAILLVVKDYEGAMRMMGKALERSPSELKYITDMLYISKKANKEDVYLYWMEKYRDLGKIEEDLPSDERFSIACQSPSVMSLLNDEHEDLAWEHLQ